MAHVSAVGSRVLAEIEETSLDEVSDCFSLSAQLLSPRSRFHGVSWNGFDLLSMVLIDECDEFLRLSLGAVEDGGL